MNKRKTIQQHLDEEEKRINDAFEKAKIKIEKLGITDRIMLGRMAGKNVGGDNKCRFHVKDANKIWELIEQGYSGDEITDYIYKNRGK